MTDYVWPNSVRISSCDWRPISNSEYTPETFGGGAQTATRPGDKLGCRVRVNNSSGAERAKLRALVHTLRGRGNRLYLPDYSFPRRGSFPAPEVLTSFDLSATTGWVPGAGASISVSDGFMRVRRTSNAASGTAYVGQTVAGLLQYVPYCWRSFVSAVAGLANLRNTITFGYTSTEIDSANVLSPGYRRTVAVSDATTGSAFADNTGAIAAVAGSYFDLSFASLTRCALVDGAGNLLLRSDEFDNAAWSKTRCTVTANAVTAPDGTATADSINEDGTAASSHFVQQAVTVLSGVADYSFSVSIRAVLRTWAAILIQESTSSHQAVAYVNLSTGAVGTVSTTGANWANLRAVVSDQGGGWYRITLTAKKVSAATTLTALVAIGEGDNDITFSGTSTASICVWRASLRQDSVASRGSQTTTAAVAIDATAQTGASIYVKGLPASTNGLLKQGDPVEISKILYPLAADLDSDGSGLGVLQLAFPPPRALSDNTPIIIGRPMGRMILMNDPEIPCVPGGFSDFEFDFVQDLAA
jgi:hypothetical protein